MEERDIRFGEKKVDESWKEQASREKLTKSGQKNPPDKRETSQPFLSFLSSLAYQTLIHFGEMEHPLTKAKAKDLNAAKEVIDLLSILKEKTKGNLSAEEEKILTSMLSDLQLKFVELSRD